MEGYIFASYAKSKKRMWLKNLYRAGMVVFTIVVALWLDDKLSKFISFLGGVACIPITFILPNLFHYNICAKTPFEKRLDIALVIFSTIIAIFCTGFTLVTWNE